jgi:TFIIF-interacting CTD phosphatase-like protein
MKSKAFILRQISELLEKNRGLCDIEIQEWIKENENMTVYELLTFKKELSKTKEYQDVSCMRWFRDEDP